MFFNNPKLLFYLKSKSLELYYLDSDQVIDVTFSPDIVRHLEIASEDKFSQTISQVIKETGLEKAKAIVVLSDHIIFDKLVSGEDSGETEKIITRFYENIPLEEDVIAKKTVLVEGKLLLLATNRQFYKIIQDIAGEFDWEIKAVIPMILFAKLDENDQLNPKQVREILNAKDLVKEANFLSEQNTSKKTTILLIIAFIIIMSGLTIYLLIFFKIIHLQSNQTVSSIKVPKASNLAAKVQESTDSSRLKKEDIRIHVLNGSSIPGQASKIKDKLIQKGYADIIIGNIDRPEATQSSIIYSQKVQNLLKDEINDLMGSLVAGITHSDDHLNEFDTLIILGKLQNPIE